MDFEVTCVTELFAGLSPRKYEQALRSARRTGYHILIPQMMLTAMDAACVVAYASTFQETTKARAEAQANAAWGTHPTIK